MATILRKRWLRVLGIIVVIAFAARYVVLAAEVTTTLPSPPTPGTFTLAIESGGFDRVAHVHIPTGYNVDTKPPLVLVLHGAGGSGSYVLERDGWAAKADQAGFIAVAPDGLPALPRLKPAAGANPALWNSGQLNPRSPRAAVDDVAYFSRLLDRLNEAVPYDKQRVFVVGHSNGGMMAFRLASELSERFTAVGAVAGLLTLENPQPKKLLPTLCMLGSKDPLMPIDGGEVKLPWGTRQYKPVSESLGTWAKAIGCEEEPKIISDEDQVHKVEYLSRSNGPTLTVLYLEGHGHHWPGFKSSLPDQYVGPYSTTVNATDAMWDFFQKHSQSGLPQNPEPMSDGVDRTGLSWTTPAINTERVQYQTFDSTAALSKVSYHIYTPEVYEKEKDRHFPVLYWLHGTGGGLAGIKPLSEFFDDAIRAEKIPPMLVVFPNGLANSMWCDSKDRTVPMETVVIKELIPHVDSTFRTVANRDGRLLEGFSMGGYGAGRLGFIHSEMFGTVSILAGGPMDLEFQGPRTRSNPAEREQILHDTFGDDLDDFKAQSPLTIAEKNAAAVSGKSTIRVVVGDRDFTADLNRAYSEHLKKLKVDHEFVVVPGVAHETMRLLKGLGEANWDFYRAAFGKK
jgi:polyhydroxybutyrate depolymerase